MNRRTLLRSASLSAFGLLAFPARPGRAGLYRSQRSVPTVSIESQGADPTGVGDSAAAFLLAITAAGVGGKVTAGAGNFKFKIVGFTDPYTDNDGIWFSFLDGQEFEGAGIGITNIHFDGSNFGSMHVAGTDSNWLHDFSVYQNIGTPSPSNAVKLISATNFLVEDVESIGGYQGVTPIGCRNGTVRRCIIHDSNPLLANASMGIHPNNISYMSLGAYGPATIHSYLDSDRITVEDCEVYNFDLGIYANDWNLGPGVPQPNGTLPGLRIIRPNIHDLKTGGLGVGIRLLGTRGAVIDGERATTGVYSEGGRSYRNVVGIQTDEAVGPQIRGMQVSENGTTGVDLIGSTFDRRIPAIDNCLIENNGRNVDHTYQGVLVRQVGRPVPTTDAVIANSNIGQTLSGNKQSWGIFAVEGEALRTTRDGGRYYGNATGSYFLGSTGIDRPQRVGLPPAGTPVGGTR